MIKFLDIIGIGGLAKEVAFYGRKCGFEVKLIDFMTLDNFRSESCIIGIGHPENKIKAFSKLLNCSFVNLVIGENFGCDIGVGNIIAPGSILAPNSKICDHVLVNYNATIGHDTFVGNFCVVGPNSSVGGKCIVGDGVYIGSGANIKENLIIENDCIIGMGAVVTKNVPKNSIVVGNPGIIFSKEEWQNKKSIKK